MKRYLGSIAKITGGVLLVIFSVYASYLEIGLSLAFGYASWSKVYRDLVVFALIFILGAWLVFRGVKAFFHVLHQGGFSPAPNP